MEKFERYICQKYNDEVTEARYKKKLAILYKIFEKEN